MVTPKKPKPPRPRHDRKPIPPIDDPGVIERRDAAINKFDRAFCANLPSDGASQQQARTGSYVQVKGDIFESQLYPVADGKYRVSGSDWIYTFEGGGFVEAEVAAAPNWGGRNVIAVPRL